MNLNLISLTYLITLVTCGTSGKAKISTHYYDVDLPRLDTNRVFCGYKGSHMDINRITAVQSLTLNECGACLKVTAKNGKFVYVMAVDKGGFGLDLNKKSFIQLFGINTGRFDAKWEKVEASHCKGILKGGNYKTPGLNGSGKKGKKGDDNVESKSPIKILEAGRHHTVSDINEIGAINDDINFRQGRSRDDIDDFYNSQYSNSVDFRKKKNSKTRSDIQEINDDDDDNEAIKYRVIPTSKEDIKYLYDSDFFEDHNFRKMKHNPKERKPEVISDKNLNSANLQGRNKDGEELTDTRRDIKDPYRRSLKRRDSEKIDNSYKVDYRKIQPLKITNEIRGNVRNDIEDFDFEFRKEKSKSEKHHNNKKDLKKPKNQNHKGTKEFLPTTFTTIRGNGRDDLRRFEKHGEEEEEEDKDDVNYRKIHNRPSKNGRHDVRKFSEFNDNDNDINFRQIKPFNINNSRKELVRNDIDDISEFSFRKVRPNSFKEKTKKNKINEDNNQPENFAREGNSVDDLNDIINISYRKKSNNGKQQDKPQKKDEKDKQHDKPSKKDSNRRINAIKNDDKIVGYTRRDMEDIYP